MHVKTIRGSTPLGLMGGSLNKFKKLLFNVIGLVCVIFGIIGVFVPVWPTTIFAIIASIMFSRANPKMHAWLLRSRFLGPYLDNYHNKRGIAMPYKIRTVWFMWSGMVFSMSVIGMLWVQIMLVAIGTAVTLHVFLIKTRPTLENDRMGFSYNIITILLTWIFFGAAIAVNFPASIMLYIVVGSITTVMSLAVFIYALVVRKRLRSNATTNIKIY